MAALVHLLREEFNQVIYEKSNGTICTKDKKQDRGQGILNIIIVSKNEETEKLYLKCIKGRLKREKSASML